jgi:DNA-binding protein Fis
MKTMWQFKNKTEQDKTIRHKSRACAKGYKQVPGKDYTELFSLVVTDMSVRTGIAIYLFHADGHDGLTYEIELIDIEAGFLEGGMDKATYIDWPTGMLEL